jgi:hypothetical protein
MRIQVFLRKQRSAPNSASSAMRSGVGQQRVQRGTALAVEPEQLSAQIANAGTE